MVLHGGASSSASTALACSLGCPVSGGDAGWLLLRLQLRTYVLERYCTRSFMHRANDTQVKLMRLIKGSRG
jgi:hypothetical protein